MPSKKSTKTGAPLSHFIHRGAQYKELKSSASSAINNDAPGAVGQNFITKGKGSIAVTTLKSAWKELKW